MGTMPRLYHYDIKKVNAETQVMFPFRMCRSEQNKSFQTMEAFTLAIS